MEHRTCQIKKTISLTSANGYWSKFYTHIDGTGPIRFERLIQWVAAEIEWSDGLIEQRIFPVPKDDAGNISNDPRDIAIVYELLGLEVFHESDFLVVGESLK